MGTKQQSLKVKRLKKHNARRKGKAQKRKNLKKAEQKQMKKLLESAQTLEELSVKTANKEKDKQHRELSNIVSLPHKKNINTSLNPENSGKGRLINTLPHLPEKKDA